MTTLSAPADGALSASAAAFLDADVPWLLAFALMLLAFAIGHGTGRVQRRIESPPAHRRTEYARFDAEMTAQLLPAGRTPAPSDEEFAEWTQRLHDALRAAQAQPTDTSLALSAYRSSQTVAHMMDKRAVCGRPAETNLGAVRCLGQPGHPGDC